MKQSQKDLKIGIAREDEGICRQKFVFRKYGEF